MITAKCNKCGGTALGNTFQEASAKINHAVALSRGIKCGDNYNMVHQVEDSTPKTHTPKESTPTEPKDTTEKPKEDTEKPKEDTEKPKSKSKFKLR